MSTPRVMLDLDGVVYEWERTARYLLRRWYREQGRAIPYALDEVSTYHDHIENSVSAEAWSWLWTTGVTSGLFREGHMTTGAAEAVHRLAELAQIVVITKRPAAAVTDTLDWLAFRRWNIGEVHTLTRESDRKSDVRPLCDVYIDDSAHILADLMANTPGHVIAFAQPWNTDAPCHYRASGWDSLLEETARALSA